MELAASFFFVAHQLFSREKGSVTFYSKSIIIIHFCYFFAEIQFEMRVTVVCSTAVQWLLLNLSELSVQKFNSPRLRLFVLEPPFCRRPVHPKGSQSPHRQIVSKPDGRSSFTAVSDQFLPFNFFSKMEGERHPHEIL